jgi:hypothetical protein
MLPLGATLGTALLPLGPSEFLRPRLGGVLALSVTKLVRKTRPRTAPTA